MDREKDQMRKLLDWKLNKLNEILNPSGQKIYIEPYNPPMMEGEEIFQIKWDRPLDKDMDIEEFVFSGSDFDIFISLNGIEYGIRMMKVAMNGGAR